MTQEHSTKEIVERIKNEIQGATVNISWDKNLEEKIQIITPSGRKVFKDNPPQSIEPLRDPDNLDALIEQIKHDELKKQKR
jgi:hypothetical protein